MTPEQERKFNEDHDKLCDLIYNKYKNSTNHIEFNENIDWDSFEQTKDLLEIQRGFKSIMFTYHKEHKQQLDSKTDNHLYSEYIDLYGKTDSFYFNLKSYTIDFGSAITNITDYAISKNDEGSHLYVYNTFEDLIYSIKLCMWNKLELLVGSKNYHEYVLNISDSFNFEKALDYFNIDL
jgi:hypothetical protein